MTDCKTIDSAPEFKFDAEKWYNNGPKILVWNGGYWEIASYGYTQKGKGRWQGTLGRIVNPTHWIPLPPPPKE